MPNKKHKILIAEDEILTYLSYESGLKNNLNCEVFHGMDVDPCFELYKQHKPDVAIIDIKLSKSSGIDLVNKIREYEKDKNKKTKIIVATAQTEDELNLELSKRKYNKYLQKSVSIPELLIELKKYLK